MKKRSYSIILAVACSASMLAASGSALASEAGTWNCEICGAEDLTTNFCGECGSKKPAETWDCECGETELTTRFCTNCGLPRPEEAPAEETEEETDAEAVTEEETEAVINTETDEPEANHINAEDAPVEIISFEKDETISFNTSYWTFIDLKNNSDGPLKGITIVYNMLDEDGNIVGQNSIYHSDAVDPDETIQIHTPLYTIRDAVRFKAVYLAYYTEDGTREESMVDNWFETDVEVFGDSEEVIDIEPIVAEDLSIDQYYLCDIDENSNYLKFKATNIGEEPIYELTLEISTIDDPENLYDVSYASYRQQLDPGQSIWFTVYQDRFIPNPINRVNYANYSHTFLDFGGEYFYLEAGESDFATEMDCEADRYPLGDLLAETDELRIYASTVSHSNYNDFYYYWIENKTDSEMRCLSLRGTILDPEETELTNSYPSQNGRGAIKPGAMALVSVCLYDDNVREHADQFRIDEYSYYSGTNLSAYDNDYIRCELKEPITYLFDASETSADPKAIETEETETETPESIEIEVDDFEMSVGEQFVRNSIPYLAFTEAIAKLVLSFTL